MKAVRHFHSINFILWLSFLVFAAFIIMFTWIFQTTLLRVFLGVQMTDDLDTLGKLAYDKLRTELPIKENLPNIERCVQMLQEDDRSATIYIYAADGTKLYPTDNGVEEYSLAVTAADGVQAAASQSQEATDFGFAKDKLVMLMQSGEDVKRGKSVLLPDGRMSYVAYMGNIEGMDAADGTDGAYLYVEYSTAMVQTVMGTMRIQLVLISVIVIFLALIISVLLSMKLTRPITRITRAAQRMAAGDFSVNFKGEYSYAEMDALAETLDYAKEEIGKSDELQKEVLANVTHDLKTPLTMIKAYASMIQEISGDNPEKRTKHTQVIIDESDRLTSLVNDILNLSKIRSGMDSLKISNFNLSEFVHTVLERFDYLTETQGFSIERDIEDELYTEADQEKIEQVVYNLVGNAINYTGEDKKIAVGLKRMEKGLRFTVTDTGKGIPPEEINTIWDRYYRSAETHKRPIKGTGLGLSIVKTILLKHGFDFGVESEVGKGSTFYVLFPDK